MRPTSDELLLPEGARLVHIGPQKTGSTAVQNAMNLVREEMRAHGVVFPGTGPRAREAGWAVVGVGTARGTRPVTMADWDELVREVAAAGDQRVVVSDEHFGRADGAAARRIVEGLGGDRAHVVGVARRLDRLLPSQWQERVKSRGTRDYETWLSVVLGDDESNPLWRLVWTPHRVEELVQRWTDVVGPDRFTLLVSDDSQRHLLPRTFERMLGLPQGLIEPQPGATNRSLTYNEVELVRQINKVSRELGWSDALYRQMIQLGLNLRLTSSAPSDDDLKIPPLPRWAAERVHELSNQHADAVKALGVRVIGDPEDLRTPPPDAEQPSTAGDRRVQVSIDLGARAVTGVVEAGVRQQRQLERLEKKVERLERELARTRAARPVIDDVRAAELARVLATRALRRVRR
jgi:hypothetical protein